MDSQTDKSTTPILTASDALFYPVEIRYYDVR